MGQIIIRILISIFAVMLTGYIFFCMFLANVAMPNDKSKKYRYQFQEDPRGFIKFSRIVGIVILFGICIAIPTGIAYIILFK